MEKNLEKRKCDVIVIGAGMAGILIAYYLKQQGKDVLLLEADKPLSGQTGRTTAKITSQHGWKYAGLIQKLGKEKAGLYAQANEAAIREYEALVRKREIRCGFERVPAYLYSTKDVEKLQQETEAALSLGIPAFFTKEVELPFPVAGAVCFPKQAQFDPQAFLRSLLQELEVWEDTRVLKIRGKRVITADMEFTAEQIVVASHYPLRNVPGFYFLRQHQERSYVLALEGCRMPKAMYYGIDEDALSIRRAGELLLLGGGAHRTGEADKSKAYDFLVQAAKQYFPEAREAARWSAQDCMPHDGVPFIGKYSIFTPHLYVATGFQKWGMTTSMVAAMILRDMLNGIQNPYARLFKPQRLLLRAGASAFLKDVGMSVKGLSQGWFGKKSLRCPHMGCKLTWNLHERSWDCPCHGSRFDAEGGLLDNPAIRPWTYFSKP